MTRRTPRAAAKAAITLSAVLIALCLICATVARAVAQETGPAPDTAGAPQPQEVTFQSGDLLLHGFLWKPAGDGPFPAVLYNHGSEKLPGAKPEVAAVFLGGGYVVFVPHRRGQGRSPGPYIGDQQAQAGSPEARNRLQVELLEQQLADQLAALDYLRTQPFVDPSHIAVAGCSYGGIQTLLGAEANPGYRAAVDFAGAAQSWANPLLRDRLLRAVQGIIIPTFLLQAQNDYTIEPSQILGAELQRLGKPYRMQIYPPFGTTPDEGHAGFCFQGGSVWGPDVLAFLQASLQP